MSNDRIGGNASSHIAGIIPQFYFDIVARITPGTLMVTVFAFSALGPSGLRDIISTTHAFFLESTFLLLLAGLVLSYALGYVLWGIWSIVLWIWHWKNKNIDPEIGPVKVPDFSSKYDCIKLKNLDVGLRITKLKAENHMAGALIAGFMLSFSLNHYAAGPMLLHFAFFVFFVGSIFVWVHSVRRLGSEVGFYSKEFNCEDSGMGKNNAASETQSHSKPTGEEDDQTSS